MKKKSIRNCFLITLFLIICLVFTSCQHTHTETPSSTETENSNVVVSNDNSADNTVTEKEDGSATTSSEESSPSSKLPNSSNTSSKPSNEVNSKDEPNPSASSSSKPSDENNSSNNTSSTPKPVQYADPDTGISWDGKSPIIYTYTDGSTGTEKKDGAKYEYLPGKWTTINFPKDDEGRLVGSICEDCGKPVAKEPGNPNTCTQYTYVHYCSRCGVYVNYHVCHSCSGGGGFCWRCGKVSGNGLNGTCLRYWSGGDHKCPNCSATIPAGRCHTCE